MLILVMFVALAIGLMFGFVCGIKAVSWVQREAVRNQRIGAAREHWAGHVSHRGHRITSPLGASRAGRYPEGAESCQ